MPDEERIRVLIVDDIAETRENIRRSLQFDSAIEVAGTARSGKEAIQLAKELKPDVNAEKDKVPQVSAGENQGAGDQRK